MVTELTARHYQSLQPVRLTFSGGEVGQVYAEAGDTASLLYAPVFFDLQINGYQGTDFSEVSSITEEALHRLVKTLYAQGVAYILPTLTTNSLAALTQAFRQLSACLENKALAQCLAGFHLEGPYISSETGPRGAHPRHYTRLPLWDEFLVLQEAARGRIKIVTLAPELPGALSFIEKLQEHAVVPAIGHTSANSQQIRDAVLAGALLSTHLGNGAHAVLPRHPNYIWDQLAEDGLWASLIVDGFHLPENVVRVMTRAKPLDKTILVTDAVKLTGMPPGRYIFMENEVELKPEGVIQIVGTDYLAGAALSMPDAIFNMASFTHLDLATSINMASQHPYRLLEQHTDTTRDIFSDRTFTLLKQTATKLEVMATIVDGTAQYLRAELTERGSA